MEVIASVEKARGCGYRKPAKGGVGVYLVGPSTGAPCGRLPFELPPCPTCGGGVHPARGWTWFEPRKFFWNDAAFENGCCKLPIAVCSSCPVGAAAPEDRHGLIWVGEAHYPTPEDFLRESREMGVSRKIKAVPKGFELGRTVVYLAHRKAVKLAVEPTECPECLGMGKVGERVDQPCEECFGTGKVTEERFAPGIFSVFRPTGIDLVIADENDVPERAQKLAEQHGARIVRVIPDGEGAGASLKGPKAEMIVIDDPIRDQDVIDEAMSHLT